MGKKLNILICGGAGCISSGCREVKDALVEGIGRKNLNGEVNVIVTGCMGPCDLGPILIIHPEGVLYRKVRPADVDEIIESHIMKGEIVTRLLYETPDTREPIPNCSDISFFNRQERIALRNCGLIDPESIEDYMVRDGYVALGRVLKSMKPQEVIDIIKRSGLRGRGGAGFPTGLKWELTAKAKGSPKYVICNADEGDPGAFMDRSILEGDPHSVLEAMIIAGYSIGAEKGYIYVRAEYPLAVAQLKKAIAAAREYGLLGKDILDSGFDFDIEIRVGAGAFVCGEETALIASIESKRGEPRPKPPFPSVSGVWNKPTLINNVETYANIVPIILKGPEWFASIGTEKSKGTKVFALAGKVNNTGLVEVPMGISLGEIVYEIGGGIPKGKRFKAAQTGGPSGGCIPKEYLNTPIDYDSLKELGTIMGSGGLIIMDEDTCMVDLAKFFLEFIQEESCGKCAPCRIGTKRMLEILTRITRGEGREGDIELLLDLGEKIASSALCGLGQSAPNPVLSTIRYFRDEYEAHIKYKKCPASICASLFKSPCQNACPAGVDVPGYISLIRAKRWDDAALLIRERNPFPSICGRVCDHPCESKCRRAQIDEAVSIRLLKRFAADNESILSLDKSAGKAAKDKGTKIAVIGSGPAGLTAAYYLAKAGYTITIFEAAPVPGGMLALGIPDYRLPKDILSKEIELIERLGVKIRTNCKVGRDISIEEIRNMGYKAILSAVGAHVEIPLGIEGEDLKGVYSGIEFLRDVNLGKKVEIGERVAVIGGGNVAMDAARTALRLGAKEVSIIYRRTRADMPCHEREIAEAEREGIKVHILTAPKKILGDGGSVKELMCSKMKLGEYDSSGRKRPVEIPGSEFIIDVDTVISAIGQKIDLGFTEGLSDLLATSKGNIIVDPDTYETNIEGLFAAGDCINGPSTVIRAIAQGREAALAIMRYLGDELEATDSAYERIAAEVNEEESPRMKARLLDTDRCRISFDEVELGYTEDEAVYEASRCLQCDLK